MSKSEQKFLTFLVYNTVKQTGYIYKGQSLGSVCSLAWNYSFHFVRHCFPVNFEKPFKRIILYTVHKMKIPIKDFFSKSDQIRSFLRIWSHLLKELLMENFIFVQWWIRSRSVLKILSNIYDAYFCKNCF